jgi:outer membrane autotransporter protein
MFIKSFAAIAAVSALGAGSAFAGPYVNIESNSGFVGSDYSATVTDVHVGYENSIGEDGSFYVQAGPALVAVDGVDTETEFSGKVGVGVDVSESVNIYGEVAFLTDGDEDNNYGTKVGVKYSF